MNVRIAPFVHICWHARRPLKRNDAHVHRLIRLKPRRCLTDVRRPFMILSFLLTVLLVAPMHISAATIPSHLNGRYVATAYSVTGVTASGLYTNRHIVAADPSLLPAGSIIKIRHAGKYQGEYVVADTGEKIVGRKLDIYIPSTQACKKFGKKVVHVEVVKLGEGTHEDTKAADHDVKKDVEQDLQKGVVGNAATQGDWTSKNGPAKATALQQSQQPAQEHQSQPGTEPQASPAPQKPPQ